MLLAEVDNTSSDLSRFGHYGGKKSEPKVF
jgi:hypothetical protein